MSDTVDRNHNQSGHNTRVDRPIQGLDLQTRQFVFHLQSLKKKVFTALLISYVRLTQWVGPWWHLARELFSLMLVMEGLVSVFTCACLSDSSVFQSLLSLFYFSFFSLFLHLMSSQGKRNANELWLCNWVIFLHLETSQLQHANTFKEVDFKWFIGITFSYQFTFTHSGVSSLGAGVLDVLYLSVYMQHKHVSFIMLS